MRCSISGRRSRRFGDTPGNAPPRLLFPCSNKSGGTDLEKGGGRPDGIAGTDRERQMTVIKAQQTRAQPTDELWQRYRTHGDPAARAQLLDRYVGLVYHAAREIGARTPMVEIDDLVSAGA